MRRAIAGLALIAIWTAALGSWDVFAYRMSTLPAKGSAHPLDADGQALMVSVTPPGIPPDPGRGPLPLCWVDARYVPPAGEPCPPVPAGSVRP